jgi:hypothetical protein
LTVVHSSPLHGFQASPLGLRRPGGDPRFAAREVELVDRRAVPLGVHPAFADVRGRADRDVELGAVVAEQRLRIQWLPAGGRSISLVGSPERGRAFGVVEAQHRVVVGDDRACRRARRCPKGEARSLRSRVLLLGHTVAVGIAQQHELVR